MTRATLQANKKKYEDWEKQQEKTAFRRLFRDKYFIEGPELKTALTTYLRGLEDRMLQLEAHKAKVKTDEAFLSNSDFNTSLVEAKKTYQQVFESNLQETINQAKKVATPAQVPDFLLSFLERAVKSVIDAYDVHRNFSDFLINREAESRQLKVNELQDELAELDREEKFLDDQYRAISQQITNIEQSPRGKQSSTDRKREAANARLLITHEYDQAKALIRDVREVIRQAIRYIQNTQLDFPRLERNALPIELMSAFLLHAHPEGARSVRAVKSNGPLALLSKAKRAVLHGFREGSISANYAADFIYQLDIEGLPNLTKYKRACLSAVLKRFPEQDYDAQSLDYYRLIDLLNRAIQLIRLPNSQTSIQEKLELASCLAMCNTDTAALKLNLREFLPASHRALERHVVVRRTFSSLMANLRDAEERGDLVNYEKYKLKFASFVQTIVNFYATSLEEQFLKSELIQGELKRDEAGVRLQIRDLVIKLINKEIADATPAPYYTSPLCGLSEYITGLHGQGLITVSRNDRGEIQPTYYGDAFDGFGNLNPTSVQKASNAKRQSSHARMQQELLQPRVTSRQTAPSRSASTQHEQRRGTGVITTNGNYGKQKTHHAAQHGQQQFFRPQQVRQAHEQRSELDWSEDFGYV